MTIEHLEVLVEELSTEALLRAFLPRVLGDCTFQVYPHLCKDDLLLRLPERLRGYASWLPATWRIIVVVDRDDDDCKLLKAKLDEAASHAGLSVRSSVVGDSLQVINRIAVEELEAWYFGDWEAVRMAYPKVPAGVPAKERFRDSDAIKGGTWEQFERVLQGAGYFRGGLRKIEAARQIGPYLEASRSRSKSFRAFYRAVEGLGSEQMA